MEITPKRKVSQTEKRGEIMDILKYEVYEMDTNPMYGKSKKLSRAYDNLDDAIKRAKEIYRKNICVLEKRYVGERSLGKDFPLTTNVAWAEWF